MWLFGTSSTNYRRQPKIGTVDRAKKVHLLTPKGIIGGEGTTAALNHSDNSKINMVDGEERWTAFCAPLKGGPDWKSLVKTLSWDNRGLVESFGRSSCGFTRRSSQLESPSSRRNSPFSAPPSHLLAKALAKGAIDMPGYNTRAEPFFNTELGMPAVKHKPVFQQTVESGEQPVKSDKPLTAHQLDNNSGKLRKAGELPVDSSRTITAEETCRPLTVTLSRTEIDRFSNAKEENYRETVRDQAARHRPKSSVYQRYYRSAHMNAVVQDAFLGHGTESPYLVLLNHIGLQYDENALTEVSDRGSAEVLAHMLPPRASREKERRRARQAQLLSIYGP
ncbi:hypothetical protein QBC46DRAFT_411986 [Diplogelasinospora grovesii]|uniref:Uncharacterized protein n=1 Tax=Diplogelasinospora grovesii TaxID=303347 RepID=A0AAN6N0V7_9PEZI|nr:hypothetical protein QBC46DRAFT_411986 [Diplogelasinospora grovesii]